MQERVEQYQSRMQVQHQEEAAVHRRAYEQAVYEHRQQVQAAQNQAALTIRRLEEAQQSADHSDITALRGYAAAEHRIAMNLVTESQQAAKQSQHEIEVERQRRISVTHNHEVQMQQLQRQHQQQIAFVQGQLGNTQEMYDDRQRWLESELRLYQHQLEENQTARALAASDPYIDEETIVEHNHAEDGLLRHQHQSVQESCHEELQSDPSPSIPTPVTGGTIVQPGSGHCHEVPSPNVWATIGIDGPQKLSSGDDDKNVTTDGTTHASGRLDQVLWKCPCCLTVTLDNTEYCTICGQQREAQEDGTPPSLTSTSSSPGTALPQELLDKETPPPPSACDSVTAVQEHYMYVAAASDKLE
eukprot:3050243-Pyramimonas_sp.AAC.1